MHEYTQINVLRLVEYIFEVSIENRSVFPLVTSQKIHDMVVGVQSSHFGTYNTGLRAFNSLRSSYLNKYA
jgi:hypothetical protein